MGHRHSRPIVPQYKPIQPPFKPIGCSGFTEQDYITDNRLAQAPFLYYIIKSKDYIELQSKILDILKTLPDPIVYNTASLSSSGSGSSSGSSSSSKHEHFSGSGSGSAFVNFMINANSSAASSGASSGAGNMVGSRKLIQGSSLLPGPTPVQNASNMFNAIKDISLSTQKTAKIFGPVYILSAYDVENKNGESWLYFPSMTKDREVYPDLWFLSNSNRWLFRIINSVSYSFKPFSSCQIHQMIPTDPGVNWGGDGTWKWYNAPNSSYVYGCKSDTYKYCKQSDGIHQAMGIYDSNKNTNAYPMTYFRSYRLDSTHISIKQYFNADSFNGLLMCFLQNDFEMFAGCRYMLVSPNKRYFYILESNKLVLYYNLIPTLDILKLCNSGVNPRKYAIKVKIISFNGMINTKMIIENGNLNIYSQATAKDPATLIWTLGIVKNGYTGTCTLVLLDDGKLKVFDNSFNDISSDHLSNLKSTIDNAGSYDYMTDYKMRLIQLTAYMKLNNMLKGGILSADDYLNFGSAGASDGIGTYIYSNFGTYDSSVDYIVRISDLIDKFIDEGKMTIDDKNEYLLKLLNISDTENGNGILKNQQNGGGGDGGGGGGGGIGGDGTDSGDPISDAANFMNSQNPENNNGYTSLLNDGYNGNNPDGNGPNQLNSPNPYDISESTGSSNPKTGGGGGGAAAFYTYSKSQSDAQGSILKAKQDAKNKADAEKENIEDILITGKSSGASSGASSGDSSGDSSGASSGASSGMPGLLTKIYGEGSKSGGGGEINYGVFSTNGMGMDMYNDALTPEEITYLHSNGRFDPVIDKDIRTKNLHRYLKNSGRL